MLFLLIFIAFIVCCKSKNSTIKDVCIFIIITNMLVSFLILIYNSEETVSYKQNITALNDYNSINSKINNFLLISNIESKDTYNIRYIAKNENGSYKIRTIKSDYRNTNIYQDNKKYIKTTCTYYFFKDTKLKRFLLTKPITKVISDKDKLHSLKEFEEVKNGYKNSVEDCIKIHDINYEIHIPKNSIATDYNIDLK